MDSPSARQHRFPNGPLSVALALAALLTPSPARGAAQSGSGWPLDEFGAKLLERSAALAPAAKASKDLRERLAPLHERYRVGAFELWLPKQVLDARGEWSDARPLREAPKIVDALARVQVRWVARLSEAGGAEPTPEALEFARWAAGWKPTKRAPTPREAALHTHMSERLSAATTTTTDPFGLIVCLVPSRAHLCAIAGAQIALDPASRAWIDAPWLSQCREFILPVGVLLVSTVSMARGAAPAELIDEPFELERALENAVHNASHALSSRHHAGAPRWWREGLAIYDTLAVLGSDETLCSGAAESSDAAELSATFDWMFWASRYKSPYRGAGSERYFSGALKRAWRGDGFELIDLDTNRPALRAKVPQLAENALVPEAVLRAPPSQRKCYAEHVRAYSTAFVHYLDSDGSAAKPSTLQVLSRELARRSKSGLRRGSALHPLALELTSRSIGASQDAARDHEAAFVAWLTR
jgi:hypothetical protein